LPEWRGLYGLAEKGTKVPGREDLRQCSRAPRRLTMATNDRTLTRSLGMLAQGRPRLALARCPRRGSFAADGAAAVDAQ
jgi:hypothetical protein